MLADTIIKSSVPVWILAFSVCMGLQRATCQLILTMLTIVLGIAIATLNTGDLTGGISPNRLIGLALVLIASFSAGFRWACTQVSHVL